MAANALRVSLIEPRKQVLPSGVSMTPALPCRKTRSRGTTRTWTLPAAQQLPQLAVALPLQQRLDLHRRLVPALLEVGLARGLRHRDVGRVQLAVADDPHVGDARDLLADQLEDGAAEVARDAPVRRGAAQPVAQERVVEPLPAGGVAVDSAHGLTPLRLRRTAPQRIAAIARASRAPPHRWGTGAGSRPGPGWRRVPDLR